MAIVLHLQSFTKPVYTPSFFRRRKFAIWIKLSQEKKVEPEMARTKQKGRLIFNFPMIYQQPPRHSTSLTERKRAYDLASYNWTITTTWDIIVRQPGQDQWYTLQQYDPACKMFKSLRKEDPKKKYLCFDGILLDPLLFDDVAEPADPAAVAGYRSTSKDPTALKSKKRGNLLCHCNIARILE
jgi:hypothetical protein